MADIYSTVQFTIELLYPLIKDEVSLLSGVKSEVERIVNELKSIKALLKNAEERAEENAPKKEWIKQVRDFAYEIEDVIEEYRLYQKGNALGKLIHILDVHSIATTIKVLQEKAIDIGRRKESYSYKDHQGHQLNHYQQSTTFSVSVTQESELVDNKDAKGELLDLLGLHDFDDNWGLIAVTGKQGLGKTTIVGSVYNDANVRSYFPICAWVPITRPYNHVHVLRTMVLQFYEAANEHKRLENSLVSSSSRHFHHRNTQETSTTTSNQICSMDEASLQQEIRKFVKEKRYMVVIDDVRDEAKDTELANYIKSVLPTSDSKGSKIIMTTRHENVARDWVAGENRGLYKLKPLPPTKAWELFCKKAFQSHGGRCPPMLHDLAWEIINICNREPYLISAMGSFLSTKCENFHEWEKVRNDLEFYLKQDLQAVYNVLIHSNYYILRPELKPCFLYFALFPKNYEVSRMRLVRLWIAEGFIRRGNDGPRNLTLEQIAQEYMNQLVHMSLVEVIKDNSGQVKSLRVPGFVHDLLFSKMEELGFCQVLSDNNSQSHVIDGNEVRPRRLSIHALHSSHGTNRGGSDLSMDVDQTTKKIMSIKSNIRSLLLTIDPRALLISTVLNKAFNILKIRLLRVIDLCDAPIQDLPHQIYKLLNLRYLSLRNTQIKKLESSIDHSRELQTLDLKKTYIHNLPSQLDKLHKLRHILSYRYIYDVVGYSHHACNLIGVKIPKGTLEKLVELQKLAFIDVAEDSRLVKELKKLRQLRRLGVTGLNKEDGKHLCAAIECMTFLESLSVYSKTKSEEIVLDHFQSQLPVTLKRLYLNGLMMAFPSWIFELKCLTKIRLRWSSLDIDPLEILESLDSLVEVQLLAAYRGKSLRIRNKGFKKLKILNLYDLYPLESLIIEKGALPLLELMAIGHCPNLLVPLGIEYIRGLETLNFFEMSWDFVRCLQPGGQYYSVVKHVPRVLFQKWNTRTASWETYFI